MFGARWAIAPSSVSNTAARQEPRSADIHDRQTDRRKASAMEPFFDRAMIPWPFHRASQPAGGHRGCVRKGKATGPMLADVGDNAAKQPAA